MAKERVIAIMDTHLKAMFDCLAQGNAIYQPSRFWEGLNAKNLQQLEASGIGNIKQTLAQNYFTWVIGQKDEQFRYLLRNTRLQHWPSILWDALSYDPASTLSKRQQAELVIFTRMLWKLAQRIDAKGLLNVIEEPEEGNPFKIFLHGKLISQDLANSIIEYYSISEHFQAASTGPSTICELGAGYGRNAYVFLKAMPRCKYIIVDIPPALYVSQHYLSTVFKDRKIFKFRCFSRFDDIAREYDQSDVVFLLPHQAEMLPKKSINLWINISSLHEMNMGLINAYFRLIDTLTKGFFYSKQWIVSHNPSDDIVVKQGDYPVPAHWRELYHRVAKVQTNFFEALYAIE